MKIVKGVVSQGTGDKTLMYDEETGQYFLVSSVEQPKETLIFKSDEYGSFVSYSEVWGTYSIDHDDVVKLLVTGRLTKDYFYNMEETYE